MKKILLFLFLAVLFALPCAAKETVIYQNDFSSPDLSDFYIHGGMEVRDGGLYTTSGSGPSAFVSYTFPEKYQGKNFQVDVDYIGHTSMGGILIGGDGKDLTETPSYFHGYACTLTGKSDHAYIAYFNREGGWGGNFAPGTPVLPESDLHLMVRIVDDVMTFRISGLVTGEQYFGVRYEIGDHEADIYDRFAPVIGLRKYYADTGHFDNLVVRILEDDELPKLTESTTLGGMTARYSGLSVRDGTVEGNGAILTTDSLRGDYALSVSIAQKGTSRLYFGMRDEKNGYALEFRESEKDVVLYKITDGKFTVLGERKTPLRTGFCDLRLQVQNGVTKITYDYLFQGEDAFPRFEMNLPDTDGRFGFWLEGGSLTNITVGDPTPAYAGETYLNPINWGADPDMLYYEGTYYLYNSVNNGKDIFRVYTSPDLAHFTAHNIVLTKDPNEEYPIDLGTAWSPNVFYHDGLFYLFFAAKGNRDSLDANRHVYYMVSDSPYGPFKPNGELTAINPTVSGEIDGHPFRDDDGRIYISYSRYDLGGTIWLQEVEMKDGTVTPIPGREARVVVPDEEYENDGGIRLVEGGVVWKHNGLYYIIYATTSYARHYGQAYAVSENVLGPYVKYEYNPILVYNFEVDGPGDALIIPSPDGNELYFVYHRHYEVGKVSPRQTCVDKIVFVPDPDGGPDILTVRGPSNTPQPLPSNVYRYDVNKDGHTSLLDALFTAKAIQSGSYSGKYDVDANGSMGLNDARLLLQKTVE